MRALLRSLAIALVLAQLLPRIAVSETLRVFAAASLTEAFEEIGGLYESEHPGDEVEFQFAGSQVLRMQIEQGAEADVFASADHVQMDALRKVEILGADSVFARNRLVVVTPHEKKPKVRRLVDLAQPGIKIVVADANVPVGRYTTQVLGKMDREGSYGAAFQRKVTANVVSEETNVRGVLAKVSLGEVDAGFVYATDARSSLDKVRVIDIPDRSNVIAECPIATVLESRRQERAAAFVALVLGKDGQAILAKRGFQTGR